MLEKAISKALFLSLSLFISLYIFISILNPVIKKASQQKGHQK